MSSSNLSKFNQVLFSFVGDLKKMDIGMKSELSQLENFLEITRVTPRTIISIFQQYFLKDVFVKSILKNDFKFFCMYDDFSAIPEKDRKIASGVIGKIQEIAKTLIDTNQTEKLVTIFKNLKVLAFFAYSDVGLDAKAKFASLVP